MRKVTLAAYFVAGRDSLAGLADNLEVETTRPTIGLAGGDVINATLPGGAGRSYGCVTRSRI
jgi:hypothetical protein